MASNFDNRTYGSSITVTGTVTAGSTITVSGVTLSGSVSVDSAGAFKFIATVTDVKVYPIMITSTKDSKTSTKTLYLLHSPKQEDYNTAQSMDYARIKANPTLNQKFIYTGTVEEVYQTTPYKLVKFKLTTGEYVVVEYYYKYALDQGKSYKLCGVPNGTYNDMPMMLTWFTYDK